MLYKFLAALFLLPASLVVYGACLKSSSFRSPRAFFMQIVRVAPSVVNKKNLLYNFFVFYPTKLGLKLVEQRSILSVVRFIVQRARFLVSFAHNKRRTLSIVPHPQPLKIANICQLVTSSSVKVVSFDIFDTLLLRPVIHPKDVFYLIAGRLDRSMSIDFVSMRMNAEEELNNVNASLDDIYEYIKNKFNLSDSVCDKIKKEEILCESAILQRRKDMYLVYESAVLSKKRIIAVSDMYMASAQLKEILNIKGYTGVDDVYVSCEYKARKDSGELFSLVLEKEKVRAHEILHIGDNYKSDYLAPLQAGIPAVHFPSVGECVSLQNSKLWNYIRQASLKNPYWGMLMAVSINQQFSRMDDAPNCLDKIESMKQFCLVVLAPMLTGMTLKILLNEEIQGKYNKIYFASRDGWLPHIAYSYLRSRVGGVSGQYFYAGRRAYSPFLYESLEACAKATKTVSCPELYTFKFFLEMNLGRQSSLVLPHCTDRELNLNFFDSRFEVQAILQRLSPVIDPIWKELRENASKYYNAVFSGQEDRFICFDVGYSGSISRGLNSILNKPIDKIYCWGGVNNSLQDKRLGTTTYLLFSKKSYSPFNLVLEELFSPCSGGILQFDNEGNPVFENFSISDAFRYDMSEIESATKEYIQGFCDTFSDYINSFDISCLDEYIDVMRILFRDVPLCNLNIMKNIVFPDHNFYNHKISLAQKIEKGLSYSSVFSGTGFEDPFLQVMPLTYFPKSSVKICIHLHVYNINLVQEFISYLQYFPMLFDLMITTSRPENYSILKSICSKNLMPSVQDVKIVNVPNRGRDVAPWLIELSANNKYYDFCCHVHTKESAHIGEFGDNWRRYLLANLIDNVAVNNILSAMCSDSKLGCVFPQIYSETKNVMQSVDVPLYGSEAEYGMICALLERMGFQGTYERSEIFFSVGTMMWYRPEALHQLFACGLSYDEFPEEPIGIGGTLAHALERVPALVSTRNGYKARLFTTYPSA